MIHIPKTDLSVHPLCLGANVFGWSADESASFAILNAYASHGGNFIDTADVYSQWKPGNLGGESETIIGKWLKTQDRQKFVIATKVSLLNTRPGLSASNILAACDDSLRRLQTDYIDIYYSHKDDPKTPLEETLGAYDKLIKAGKVRYIAAAQYSGARLQEALNISAKHALPSYIALQDQYNLVHREPFESEQAAVLATNGLSSFPFYGLARGFLSGKYRPGLKIDSVRAEGVAEFYSDQNWKIIEALRDIAQARNASVSAIALAWLRSHPQVCAPIASARTTTQLEEIVQILELSAEEMSLLNTLSKPLAPLQP
jgi:aryl-alcohol dehydrogenase-like predicted oxidoreductase